MGFSEKKKKKKCLGDRQKRSKGEMENRSISSHEMADTETEGSAAANTYTWEKTPDSMDNFVQAVET